MPRQTPANPETVKRNIRTCPYLSYLRDGHGSGAGRDRARAAWETGRSHRYRVAFASGEAVPIGCDSATSSVDPFDYWHQVWTKRDAPGGREEELLGRHGGW